MFNTKNQKQKFLSKLIAFTFAFNTIVPVAFASEEVTTSSTTSGVSLSSASNDILTRIANTQATNFKSRNLNISNEEINNLMNIPLSTAEEDSYLSQEEKDYNNLQLLIAKGLNTAEARATALKKLQDIENLSKTDESVGGLTTAEKYVKSLLENYDDIESRSSINDTIGSAITTTDNAVLAYRTILKVAKAERLACRNDATANKAKADKGETLVEGTNTDPDKCELSAKGKEAAQMLTYISNQQVNQTTDAKKTTNATNTSTSSSGERKCESPATPTVAINDNTKCCPTQQPFYNSSTGKCVASLATNTNTSSNKDDDDDSNSDALLAQYLLSQQQNCPNPNDWKLNMVDNRCTLPTGGSYNPPTKEETTLPSKPVGSKKERKKGTAESKTAISGNSEANSAVMNRISDIKIEFNENNRDDKGYYVHINDASSEYKLTVTLEEKETNENQNPLKINVYASQYVGEDVNNATLYRFNQRVTSGIPVTVVYPENMKPTNGNGHFIKKVLGADEYYTLAITITDGTYESAPFYIKYKIVDFGNKIVNTAKDQTAGKISIIGQQSKINYSETTGNASLDVSGAKYENGVCKLSVDGALVTSNSENTQKISASEYQLDSINEADCIKLNEDAQNNKLHMTANNAQIQEVFKDGSVTLNSYSDTLPAFSLDGGENYLDTKDYLTSTDFDYEDISYEVQTEIPIGKYRGEDIVFAQGNLKVRNKNGALADITTDQLSEALGYAVPEGTYTELAYDKDGRILINIKDDNDKLIEEVTTDEMAQKTIREVHKTGLESETAKSVDRVVKGFTNATVKMIGGQIIAEKFKETSNTSKSTKENAPKKVDASTTTPVEKTAPADVPTTKK